MSYSRIKIYFCRFWNLSETLLAKDLVPKGRDPLWFEGFRVKLKIIHFIFYTIYISNITKKKSQDDTRRVLGNALETQVQATHILIVSNSEKLRKFSSLPHGSFCVQQVDTATATATKCSVCFLDSWTILWDYAPSARVWVFHWRWLYCWL